MWNLQSLKAPDEKYELLSQRDVSVGRVGTDIQIANDPSVSRRHAVFSVLFQENHVGMPACWPTVQLKDESRFGTIVNGTKIDGSSMLKDGDIIKFGTVDTQFVLQYEPFVVTTSCIAKAGKAHIKSVLAELGGHVMSEWRRDCSLLVMSELTVTVKTVCALIQQKPIVTPQYMDALLDSYRNKTGRPDPKHFQPPLNESQLKPGDVQFTPVEARRTLFSGLRFIFLNPTQFHKLSLPVELAGGMSRLLEEGAEEEEDGFLTDDGVLVMQADREDASLSQNGRQWVADVQQQLARKGRRMIPEADIGFAVLFASLDTHCNPHFDSNKSIADRIASQSLPTASLSQSQLDLRGTRAKRKTSETAEGPIPKRKAVDTNKSSKSDHTKQDISNFFVPNSLPQGDPSSSSHRLRAEAQGVVPETQQLVDSSFVATSEKAHSTTVERRSARTRNRPSADALPMENTATALSTEVKHEPDSATHTSVEFESVKRPQCSTEQGRPAKNEADDEWQGEVRPAPRRRSAVTHASDDDEDFPISFDFGSNGHKKSTEAAVSAPRTESSDVSSPAGMSTTPASTPGRSNAQLKQSESAQKVIRQSRHLTPEPAAHTRELSPDSMGFIDMNIQKRIKRSASTDRYFEPELPQDCAEVRTETLVCERSAPPVSEPARARVLWKGRMVDNFKKFKKKAGECTGPRIIGAASLVQYSAPTGDEREEFIADAMRVENEKTAAAQRAEQLFNWDPPRKGNRR